MRKNGNIIVAAVMVFVFAVALLGGCSFADRSGTQDGEREPSAPAASEHLQDIAVTESTEAILNPDQGFYRPMYVTVNEGGVSYPEYVITEKTQLYHLRIDISAFSAKVNGEQDEALTGEAIGGIEKLLSFVEAKGKNAIVRFAYDPKFGGSADKEPSLDVMLGHIEQISAVLNKFQTAITAVEVGLVGPWGEMHTSAAATSANIKLLTERYLRCTHGIAVLVRTPKMMYDYLGITLKDIDGYEIDEKSEAYRLGIYNDGYLGSSTDLGTYTDREKEIAFLSKQTARLPYGGEVVVPSSNLHDIENCLPEMFGLHLSYLNEEWNNEVINKWKNSEYDESCGDDRLYYGKSAFTYISNRMGYRFVLTRSKFIYSDAFDKLTVKLGVKNLGFGNLNKTKFAKLLFVREDGEIACESQAGTFCGNAEAVYETALSLDNGKYEVYLRLYGDEKDGKASYCLQFANEGIWNGELCANKIGEIEIRI